ncbi:MAG: XRE family transcriptional regulator [Candidatus Cybelea sp.]
MRVYVQLFDKARLRLARQYRAIKKVDLARLVGLTPSALTQIESGAVKPKTTTVMSLSLALGFPIDYFIADGHRPPIVMDQGRSFFRSLRSTRQMDRDQAEALAVLANEVLRGFTQFARLPECDLPTTLFLPEDASFDQIESAAEELRHLWSVPSGPIANVVRLLESHGVAVTKSSISASEVDSFSRWFDERPLLLLRADNKDLPRLRFDAAHELGHLVLHNEIEPANRVLEQQAHRFAAAFLMPRTEIRGLLPASFNISEYGRLKGIWGVSIQALLYRARDLGRMSEATYRRAMMRLNAQGLRRYEPFPIDGEEEPLMWQRALEIVQSCGTDPQSFEKQLRLPTGFLMAVAGTRTDLPSVSLLK